MKVLEGLNTPLNLGYIAGPTYKLEYMLQIEYGFLSNKPWYTKFIPFEAKVMLIPSWCWWIKVGDMFRMLVVGC